MPNNHGVKLTFQDLSKTVTLYNQFNQNGVRAGAALRLSQGALWRRLMRCREHPALKARLDKKAQAIKHADWQKVKQSTIAEDQIQRQTLTAHDALKRKYSDALIQITKLEKDLKALGALSTNIETWQIKPRHGSGTSEGTIIVLASDWHVEEEVGDEVGGLNRYTLGIAKTRAETFFAALVRLTKLLQQDIKIEEVVLALLGDFITNDIHEELVELNQKRPVDAIVFAQNLIAAGIEHILQHTKVRLTIPCHSGNHGRTTKTTHFSTERGHSLEYLMYLHLATYFRNEPRVQFILAPGYHSYVTVYDRAIRFHHGHAIKYAGGIGGIFIPAYKAIAQWNKAIEKSPLLDCFGHFHQAKDGGNFISNGSLIGYNGFALSIKADFEVPKQQMFLIDKRRGRTCTWPIYPEKPR